MEPTIAYNPAPPVNPLDQTARVLQLKNLLGQGQVQQQQIQAGALANQQTQMDVDSQRAFQRAYMDANGDPDKTTQLAAKYGAKPKDLLLWQGSVIDQKMKTLDLVQKQGDLAKLQADLMQGAHDAVTQADPASKPAVYQQQLMGLKQRGIDTSQLPQQYPGDQQFAMIGASVKTHTQMVDEMSKVAQASKDTAQANQATAETQQKQAQTAAYQGSGMVPGITPDAQSFLSYMRTVPGAKAENYPAWKAQQEAIATGPQKIAVAQAEGQARANVEAQAARGSNAALAQVPPHLIGYATQAATKAAQDYDQAKSVSDRLDAMMTAAKNGNVVSYQLIPQEGALQVTTSQGVHRINMAEIQNYGGGSLWQRLQGHIGKQLTGQSIPDSVLNDMSDMQSIQKQGARQKYEADLKAINQNTGSSFQPMPEQASQIKQQPRQLTDVTKAREYLQQAGGDKQKARALARQDGWTF